MCKLFKKKIAWLLLILTPCVLMVVLSFWPLNGYIESPGQATALSQLITVDGKRDDQAGDYRLTSVAVRKATALNYLIAKIQADKTYVPSESLTGGQSDAEFTRVQQFYMRQSLVNAEYAACQRAHRSVTLDYRGIYVLSVTEESTLRDVVAIGDTIVAVDGHHFDSSAGFIAYLGKKAAGEEVHVQLRHQDKDKTVTGKTITLPKTTSKEYPHGRTGLGVILTDDVSLSGGPDIQTNVGNIGGPSAGLMFSLQIYGQLTGKDLRHGRTIAGTGTVDSQGHIGEIGGIDKKISGAQATGATVFFVPYVEPSKQRSEPTNYEVAVATAKKKAPNMILVPVRTLDDAITYLETGNIITTKTPS